MDQSTTSVARGLVWVFMAGGLGATLRVAIATTIDARWSARLPHVGTLVVNMLGCLAIGIAAAAMPPGTARNAVIGGLLGGFTTYSAFALFSVELAGDAKLAVLAVQIITHLVLGILCVWLGQSIGRAAFGTPSL